MPESISHITPRTGRLLTMNSDRSQDSWDKLMSMLVSRFDGDEVEPEDFAAAVAELLAAVRETQQVPRLQ